MKAFSIRTRLTATYAAILAVSFCLFGAGMFFEMRYSINRAVDEELQGRLQGIRDFLEHEGPQSTLKDLRDEFDEHLGLTFKGDLLVVTDDQGRVVYHSGPTNSGAPEFGSTINGQQPIFANVQIGRRRFREVLSTLAIGPRHYAVRIGTPMRGFNGVLEEFESVLISAIPVILIAASLAGYWVSRRALRPVDEITRSAQSITEQSLSLRLKLPGTNDELQRLSETLNDMIGRLENAFKRITRFTADASHELRTPIALARLSAELTLRRERSAEEYQAALMQITAELDRTTVLIENLLTLARMDAGALELQKSKIDLISTVRQVCSQGEQLAAAKRLTFDRKLPATQINILGDAQALQRLFLILVDNAVKYTNPGGHVSLSLKRRDGFAVSEIADSGIGIHHDELGHIFERFYRADQARPESGGTGLGLSIALAIAEAHGASIEVQSSVGKGSLFRVRIPAVSE